MNPEVEKIIQARGYTVIELIGQGGFAQCFKVYSSKYNREFAMKIINLSILDPSKKMGFRTSFLNETQALSKMTHPNIISLYDHFEESEHLFLVLEYCNGGSLGDDIKKGIHYTDKELIKYVSELALALNFTHKRLIVHHDIKPANILRDSFNRTKLADFGLAKEYKVPHSEYFKGSVPYMAPEVFARQNYDPFKADVWSFGVTVYQLATGQLPFRGESLSDIKEHILSGFIPKLQNAPIFIQEVLRYSLIYSPENRASMSQIVNIIGKYERNASSPNINIVSKRPRCFSPMMKAGLSTLSLTRIKSTTPSKLTPSKSMLTLPVDNAI